MVNAIPTRSVLEVVRDGGGRWDTRSIDLELGRRGARIETGILVDLRRLADQQNAHPVLNGPALVFSALITDMDYYNNRSGCAHPLYRNAAGTLPNLVPGLVPLLGGRLGMPVAPEDILAHIAAVASHPDYSERFQEDLEVPGARIPLTADPRLWERRSASAGVFCGCTPTASGTPRRRPEDRTGGCCYRANAHGAWEEIPDEPEAMPEKMSHDPVTQDLWIGAGRISPVPRAVREYEVSGMNVLDKWFGYRRKQPAGKRRIRS